MSLNNELPEEVTEYLKEEPAVDDNRQAKPDENTSEKPKGPVQSPIMPEAEQIRRPVFDPTGKVEQINEDEIKIADVRRHPFGLFLIYLQMSIGLALSFGLIFVFLPGALKSLGLSSSGASGLVLFLGLIVVLLALIFFFLITRIYNSNQLIITNDNVTQITQAGLFHRKVSEISMGNVEDVSAHQSGIFPTLFNYGRVHVETAGEQDNYNFIYCPNPNAYAKAVQDARLEFIKTHGD